MPRRTKRPASTRYEVGQSSTPSATRPRTRSGLTETMASQYCRSALPAYADLGDCTYICEFCGAAFWFGERLARRSKTGSLLYTQCCKEGTVVLPIPLPPPQALRELFRQRSFMSSVRAYNAMFAMTSFGANVDDSVNDRPGPYTFKIRGQIYHWIGSIFPHSSGQPRFLQLYIYDTDNEVSNRLSSFRGEDAAALSEDTVLLLSGILNATNEYVRTFTTAAERAAEVNLQDFCVRLYNNVPDRRYDPPAPGTLGAIVFGDDMNASQMDVVVFSKTDGPQSISRLHPSYMPFQYPLLFPYGEDGWRRGLQLRNVDARHDRTLTINMWFSSLLHPRPAFFSLLFHGGRLLQQFIVDSYVCIEQCRLDYLKINQADLRTEYVSGVYDAMSKGDNEGYRVGQRTILPASFVGGPRYMYKHYQDALAICRLYGNPQYFVTFTCNPTWPEIRRYATSNELLASSDRADIIARVFHLKVTEFIQFMKNDCTFGPVVAHLYTIEFQKRGLPHCHTLIWVSPDAKITSAVDVDKYISAELPDPVADPSLYATVTKYMIHGPCGLLDPRSVCMKKNVCSKRFPKPFSPSTFFDDEGYVHYKRRSGVYHQTRGGIQIHNGFVVPYNRRLCARFDAHINVEYCGWNMMIKYLFKYISKGADQVYFNVQKTPNVPSASTSSPVQSIDEIEKFTNGRYICPHEAAWRIFNFPIQERQPAVQVLAVHLEYMQVVMFKDSSQLQRVTDNPAFGRSTLLGWMRSNAADPRGRHLKYLEYPSLYWWDVTHREWVRRVRDGIRSIGRLIYVHPTTGELFYLRMLLMHQKGCTSYDDIKFVNGIPYPTFRLACDALGLLGNDREWLSAFLDAAVWASAPQLRLLFTSLLLYCNVTDPILLWNEGWRKMSDDISYVMAAVGTSKIDDSILQEHVLIELEKLLLSSTPPSSLKDYHLPMPSGSSTSVLENRLVFEETSYDTVTLQQQHLQMLSKLNPDQLDVYQKVENAHRQNKQLLLFVYGHGGTGKTFLWSTILAYFRSQKKIVLAVASSGIAALLMPSGRTAHSRLKIPPDITEKTVCVIKKRTDLCNLLCQTSLIIWDEATMSDRRCFECVDRTFRDLLSRPDLPFGGMSLLLGGDFRQTLPVLPKKKPSEIMAATLPNSPLWHHFSVATLHHNMRLSEASEASIRFASWLLEIGNGDVGLPLSNGSQHVKVVDIPSSLLIGNSHNPLDSLIRFVYTPQMLNNPSASDLSNRAIVCPKNDSADHINELVLQMSLGDSRSYCSVDSIVPHIRGPIDLDILYPKEYLNRLQFPGIPLHTLKLKVNCPIILIRNINQDAGLCNGTRLIVTQMLEYVVQATVITGISIGQTVYIPKIPIVHDSSELPFVFTRKQLPIKVCYAMTINKSQGQSLSKVGIYLPQPVFGHGQLYVALSRATSPESIKMLILDTAGNQSNTTHNVVFKELLNSLPHNK